MSEVWLLFWGLCAIIGFVLGIWLHELTRTKYFWEPQPRGRVRSADVEKAKERIKKEIARGASTE